MSLRSLAELLSHDVSAEGQTVRAHADAKRPPRESLLAELPSRRPVRGDDHSSHVTPALAAEVAPRLGVLLRSKRSPPIRPLFAFSEHLVGEIEAPLADEYIRPSYELGDVSLGGPTEAARPVSLAFLNGALAGSRVHDLMDPLVTEPERIGDIPKRCSGRVQSPDGVLISNLSPIGLELEAHCTISLVAGLPEELRIECHLSTVVDGTRAVKTSWVGGANASRR